MTHPDSSLATERVSATRKTLVLIVLAAVLSAATIPAIRMWRSSIQPFVLMGAVLRDDPDPRKQTPVAAVTITATAGASSLQTKSDAAGFYRAEIHPGLLPARPVTLYFEHPGYKPSQITVANNDRLYIVRLQPKIRPAATGNINPTTSAIRITNVRVRYAVKSQTTITVGSVAKQFDVENKGNQPCQRHPPCSPDGKWRAATATLSIDAGKDNEFRNTRASCIAGPCPFTRIEPADLSAPARKIEITALDWSDSASFLVEAEVTRTMPTNMVLQSYPFIIGQAMTFALPPDAEGPSIVADLSGQQIVFPLGPNLLLSWATCSVEVGPGKTKIYRCDLKPGYHFP